MQVIDFISVVDEYATVEIYDEFGKLLTEYNGKDSIDEKYNFCDISRIENTEYAICLYLDINTIF